METNKDIQALSDEFKRQADVDLHPADPNRLLAFDYFKRGAEFATRQPAPESSQHGSGAGPERGSLADHLFVEQREDGIWLVCVEGVFKTNEAARAACQKWKAAYSAAPPVNRMVDRFLGWKLPEDFGPDAGISFDRSYSAKWGMPVGTNLLTADQAKAMFEYCLAYLSPADAAPVDAKPVIKQEMAEISAQTRAELQRIFDTPSNPVEAAFKEATLANGSQPKEWDDSIPPIVWYGWCEFQKGYAAQPSTAQGDAVGQQAGDDLPVGFEAMHLPYDDAMTAEYNAKNCYIVKRIARPFCDENGVRMWSGPTLAAAVEQACSALKLSQHLAQRAASQPDGERDAAPAENLAVTSYWARHYAVCACTLCGNSGLIDTAGVRTAAGVLVGGVQPCICPNGQARRRAQGDAK